MPPSLRGSRSSIRKTLVFWTLIFLFGIFGLSVSGRQASPDEEIYYRTAVNYLTRFEFTMVPPTTIPAGHHQLIGSDGKIYPSYGPCLLVFHLPLVLMGDFLPPEWLNSLRSIKEEPFAEPPFDRIEPRITFSLAGMTAGIIIALFVARAGRVFDFSPFQTFLAMITICLATPIWPFVKTAFRDLPQTAFTFGGMMEGIVALRTRCPIRAGLAGAMLGLAFLAKDQAIVNFLLLLIWLGTKSGLSSVLMAILGFIGAGLPLFAYKIGMHGNLGEVAGTPFWQQLTTPVQIGFPGVLISPGRGLFIFSPVLLWGIWGLKKYWDSRKEEAALIFINIFSIVIISSIWRYWHGGLSWGPRLLLPMVPFMGLLAILGLRESISKSGKYLFGLMLAAGILINVGGVALDWHLFHVIEEYHSIIIEGKTTDEFYDDLAFSPGRNIILAGWRALGLMSPAPPPGDLLGTPVETLWHLLGRSKEMLWIKAWKGNNYYYLGWAIFLLSLILVASIRILQLSGRKGFFASGKKAEV